MAIQDIINDIEKVLNDCGDSVSLIYTGFNTIGESLKTSCEIQEVKILKTNNCFSLPIPQPKSPDDTESHFIVNRIRFSKSMIKDYEKGSNYSSKELRHVIEKGVNLFGFYPKN